jgi:tetratricopeptide (TPR) repeat protein
MAARKQAGADLETETLLGNYLSESGRLAEALPILEHAAASPAAGVDAINALGIAYARSHQDGKALATFGEILKIDPRNAMAMQNVGSVHLAAGQLDAAEAAFKRTLEINSTWAAAYTGLGAVRLERGDRAGAIDAWTRAVTLNPSDFDALFNLATELINAKRFDEARPFVQKFVDTAPPAEYRADIARLRAWLK